MENEIGKKIRYHRIKLNMTQSELAKGVISVSYLSKIENYNAEPPPEVTEHLFKKLNIDPLSKETENIFTLCENWFRSLLRGEKRKAAKIYKDINNDTIANTPLVNLVEIHKLHYFILTKQKLKAKEQLQFLHKISKNFKNKEKYYWLKISGNYYFACMFYNKAINLFFKAEDYVYSINSEEEKNDLFYLIAVTASKLRRMHLVDLYGNKALNYYQNSYHLKRCAECHILLGILYQRTNEFDKSMDHYQLSLSVARNIGNSKLLSICFQNIGKLYSDMNKSEKAIEFYCNSYQMRHNNLPDMKIIPVSSLMKEYYKKGDHINAEKWLEKGLALSNQLDPSDSIYTYEFKVYKNLIKGFDSTFEPFLIKKVIPFMEKRNLNYETYIYLEILANYFFSKRRYKLAAQYYKRATQSLTNIYKD